MNKDASGFLILYLIAWVLAQLWSFITGKWRDKGEGYEKIWEAGSAIFSFLAGMSAVGFVVIGLKADLGIFIILVLAAGVALAIFPAIALGASAKKKAAAKRSKTSFVAGKNLWCRVLGHKWHHCACERCGEKRDAEHDWDGCQCAVCGKTRDEDHDLDETCTCRKCGKVRHDWDGCRCSRCGVVQDYGHDWHGCTCRQCGQVRNEGHNWVKDENDGHRVVCSICGQTMVAHVWVHTPTEKEKCLHQCSVCGEKALIHKGKCKCEVCGDGIPVLYAHDWHWGIEKKCRHCGTVYKFYKNLTNVAEDVETYEWRNNKFFDIGRCQYVLRGSFYDECSDDLKGYYLLNLADRSKSINVSTQLSSRKRKRR